MKKPDPSNTFQRQTALIQRLRRLTLPQFLTNLLIYILLIKVRWLVNPPFCMIYRLWKMNLLLLINRMKLLHRMFLTFRITKLLCWHISARNRRKLLPLLFNPQPSRTALPAQHFPLQAPLFCTIITFQWPQMTRLPFWQTLFLIWRTWRQQQWSRESLQTV